MDENPSSKCNVNIAEIVNHLKACQEVKILTCCKEQAYVSHKQHSKTIPYHVEA